MLKRLMVQLAPDDGGNAGTGDGANSQQAGDSLIGNSGEPSGNSGDSTGTGNQSAGWQSIMPAELRGNDAFKGHESAASFFKAVAGKTSAQPEADADQKAWDAWRTEKGIPTESDKYDLKNMEGLSAERTLQLKTMYHEMNLDNKGANDLHEKMMGMLGEGAENLKARDEQMKTEYQNQLNQQRSEVKITTEKDLRKDWGVDYTKNITQADRVLKALVPEADLLAFNAGGYLNNATFIKMMHSLGDKISGDSIIGGNGQQQSSPSRLFPNSPSMYNK